MTTLINDLLVARRPFAGLFVFGGAKRFLNIINNFNITVKEKGSAQNTAVRFMSEVALLNARFHSIVKKWSGPKDFSNVRQVSKVSSIADERTTRSTLGGRVLLTYSGLEYARVRDRLKAKHRVDIDDYSFFRNFNPFALSKLQRWSKDETGLGDHSTFTKPLLFYYKTLGAVKNTEITRGLLGGIIHYVNEITRAAVAEGLFDFVDDIVRQFLAEVDKLTFVLCQQNSGNSLIYSSLHGLGTFGGPRGWTKESVLEGLKDWVSGERKFPYEEDQFLNDKLDTWIASWCSGVKSNDLAFKDFITDPMRWATGGGARKKQMSIRGKVVEGRNKWFWALSCMVNGEDIYQASLSEGNDAQVALKEEAKTRCVITTPQASYLRQCYILYRLGKPKFLRSTLSNPGLVTELSRSRKDHFICIDSSSFDHSVSKNWILSVLQRIADRSEGELRSLVLEEMDSMRDMSIVYEGTKLRYENGLLSGWRMTSLLGSLLSALVCEYINNQLGLRLPYIVQGDDIIMMCPQRVDAGRVLDCCARFGITTNAKKTTIGRFGEFLKYRYGYGRVQGYAARAVRSIFYANPWLDGTATSSASEVSGKWWTLLSRLMNSHNGTFVDEDSMNWFLGNVVDDVDGWLGKRVSRRMLLDAVKTPVSMGGLGVFETAGVDMSRNDSYITKITSITQQETFGDAKFLGLFAPDVLTKVGKVATRLVDIKRVAVNFGRDLAEFKSKFYSMVNTMGEVVYDSGSNIFRTVLSEIASCRNYPPLVDTLLGATTGPCHKVVRPRFLKNANRWYDIAKWLTGATMKAVCPPSLFVDTRYDNELVQSLAGVALTMFMNLPNVTAKSDYLISVFAFSRFSQTKCILHAL